MKVVTPAQMNEIDRICIEEIGIPGIVLMENAALKVVDEIKKELGELSGKNIIIFAGKGNNGGDAYAVARHLYNNGAKLSIYTTSGKETLGGDVAINLGILLNMGLKVGELQDEGQLKQLRHELAAADIVIDGILGTGIKREIKDLTKDIIELINNSAKNIISIDIPSGISGETGQIMGSCIRANKTVTFGLPKIGLVVHPGCEFTGELIVADIGIPAAVRNRMGIKVNIVENKRVLKIVPDRRKQSNKGDYGKILVVTGSAGMTGAGSLTGKAALRSGAGLVYLGVPASLAAVYDTLLAEAVTIPLEDSGSGHLVKECSDKIMSKLESMDAAVIGPGLSVSKDVLDVVRDILENAQIPLVLDADALNAISRDVSVLQSLQTEAVITPHPGEMSRLLGISVSDVQNNRIDIAREFSHKWNVITVLKGSRTVVASPDGTVFINPTGNSGMATAGTGDALAGVIAALAAQGAKLFDAAVAGVFIHGLAGDAAAAEKSEYGMIASDLVEQLPNMFKKLADGR